MRDTRYIIAEQAQRIIVGGTPTADNEVTTEELLIYVDQCFGKLMTRNYFEQKTEGDTVINGAFIYSFVEDVLHDVIRDKFYIYLPSTYVNLPSNVGVYSVSPVKDEFNTCVPVPTNFLALANNLEVLGLEGRMGYYIEANKLFLFNTEHCPAPENLLVKLVGGIQDTLSPDVDMPLDLQAELVTMVVELYRFEQAAEKDITNDNIK